MTSFKSFSSCEYVFLEKASKSGKSIGLSSVPPFKEKLNLHKCIPFSAIFLATKFQAPQSL